MANGAPSYDIFDLDAYNKNLPTKIKKNRPLGISDPNMATLFDSLIDQISSGGKLEALELLKDIESLGGHYMRSGSYNAPPGTWGGPGGSIRKGKEGPFIPPSEVWKGIPYLESELETLNPIVTDSGHYQFNKATVDRTIQRGKNIGINDEFFKNLDPDPKNWEAWQADTMALISLFPMSLSGVDVLEEVDKNNPLLGDITSLRKGKPGEMDSLIMQLFDGFDYITDSDGDGVADDVKAFKDIYYTLWQTDPDSLTIKNVNDKIDKRNPKSLSTQLAKEIVNKGSKEDITDVLRILSPIP
tara:strand:- start:254 stop:1153 length:900 start_codon:yes stop_codon:yes gene_type:complete